MGLRPVVELQFADFLLTAGDEVFFKAGMWRFMHGGAFDVPMVLPCVCALAQHEGDHRRRADQADCNKQDAHHSTKYPVTRRPPP